MPGGDLRLEPAPWPGWDELAGAGRRLGSDWLAMYRRRPRGREVAALLRRGGEPVVGLLGFELGGPAGDSRLDPEGIFGVAALPALVLLAPDWRCRPAGPLADDPGALSALLAALERRCGAGGLRGVALLYAVDGEPLAAAAERAGWRRAPLTPWCELDVRWRDLAGYRALLARKDRQQVRRDERALAAAGVIAGRQPLDRWAAQVLGLRCRLLGRRGRPVDEATELACLRRAAAREHLMYGATAGERLLGFTLFLRHADELVAYWTGRDDADPRSSGAYFATTFYAPAADAPALGTRRIVYGLGAWRAKRRCGCRLLPTSGWLYRA